MSFGAAIGALVSRIAYEMNLRNAPGPDAYQMAVASGFTGDRAAWQASLVGNDYDYAGYLDGLLITPPRAGAATETQAGITQFGSFGEIRDATAAAVGKAVSVGQLANRLGAIICASANDMLLKVAGAPTGTVFAVGQFSIGDGGANPNLVHRHSTWFKGLDGKVYPHGPIRISGGADGNPLVNGRANAGRALGYFAASQVGFILNESEVVDDFGGRFRVANPVAGTAANRVVPWDTAWYSCNVTVQGFAGAYGASNGWISSGTYIRYRGGRVGFRGNIVVNGSGAVNGQLNVSLPVPQDTLGGFVLAPIDAVRASTSVDYVLFGFVGTSWLYTGATNNAASQSNPTGTNVPFTWAQSDLFRWNFEYDPA